MVVIKFVIGKISIQPVKLINKKANLFHRGGELKKVTPSIS